MNIAFFGSSLVSAYWNGAATYYRGIIKGLAGRGHNVTFYEPDAFERQEHRDMDDPDWARVVVYKPTENAVRACLREARDADLVVKASGVGVFDTLLEMEVLALQSSARLVAFWDVDAPATLVRVNADPDDPFAELIPRYDMVLTYGGGQPVVRAYEKLGAKLCAPIYNALDPDTHYPAAPEDRFCGSLGFLGNRLPDREARVDEFFLKPAGMLPHYSFILGGNGWGTKEVPENVRAVGHVFTRDHNAFNCSAMAVLNINRDSMAANGYSPATRVFEAAGAGACLISDAFVGIEEFLEPSREVLVAVDGTEVAAHLAFLDPSRCRSIGQAARKRVLAHHTYAHRVAELEGILDIGHPPKRTRSFGDTGRSERRP